MKNLILICIFTLATLFANDRWEIIQGGDLGININALSSLATNLAIYVGTDEGLYESPNGTDWTKKATTNAIYSLSSYGNNLYATELGAIYVSEDNGNNWEKKIIPPIQDQIVWSVAANQNRVYIFVLPGNNEPSRFFYSIDNGGNWIALDSALFSSTTVNNITLDGDNIYLATNSGVRYSMDLGSTWNHVLAGQEIMEIIIENGIFYASGSGSTNENPFQGKIYKSEDNGENWIESFVGITESSCSRLTLLDDVLYIGCGLKSFYAEVSGFPQEEWTSPPLEFFNSNITSIINFEGNIYSTSFGQGLWRLVEDPTVINGTGEKKN